MRHKPKLISAFSLLPIYNTVFCSEKSINDFEIISKTYYKQPGVDVLATEEISILNQISF